MKKNILLCLFCLFILFVFSCEIPEMITIKGTPSLELKGDRDLSSEISDNITNNFKDNSDITVIKCTNTSVLTYVLHMDIIPEDQGFFEMPDNYSDAIENQITEAMTELDTTDLVSDGEVVGDKVDDYVDEIMDQIESQLVSEGSDELEIEIIIHGVPVRFPKEAFIEALFRDEETKEEIKTAIKEDPNSVNNIDDVIASVVKDKIIETVKNTENLDLELDDDLELIQSDSPLEIPLDSITKYLNNDFNFSGGLEARLYVYAVDEDQTKSDITELISIKLEFNSDSYSYDNLSPYKSGFFKQPYDTNFNKANLTYSGSSLPNHTNPDPDKNNFANLTSVIQSLLSAGDTEINYKIYIDKETTIPLKYLDKDFTITAEIVIWLPMSLTANKNNAVFSIPLDDIDDNDDLFGRDSPSSSEFMDYIDSLDLEITLSEALATGAKVVFANKGATTVSGIKFYKEITIKEKIIQINLSPSELEKINNYNNYPFVPEVKILFNNGSKLEIPRNLNLLKIKIDASILIEEKL